VDWTSQRGCTQRVESPLRRSIELNGCSVEGFVNDWSSSLDMATIDSVFGVAKISRQIAICLEKTGGTGGITLGRSGKSMLAGEAEPAFAIEYGYIGGQLNMTASEEYIPGDFDIGAEFVVDRAREESESRGSDSNRFISQFAEHQHAIYAYTRALVQNRSDAEDIMQNVSIALWKKWHTFDPNTSFLRWAFAVAFIEILRYRRKLAKDRLWFSEPLLELLSADFQQNAEVHSSRLDALSLCLEKLDHEDRRLIEIRYRQSGSVQSVADEFDKPLSTVYKMLLRVRQTLRDCINRSVAAQSHPSNA